MRRFVFLLPLACSIALACTTAAFAGGVAGLPASIRIPSNSCFVENRGQVTDTDGRPRTDVLYTADIGTMRVHFRRDGVSYVATALIPSGTAISEADASAGNVSRTHTPAFTRTESWRMDVTFGAGYPGASVTALGEQRELRSYYIPSAPDGITGVRTFSRIEYTNVQPGIDLAYYFTPSGLKYDVIVHPGADPASLRMKYDGALALARGENGVLRASTALGSLEEDLPAAFIETRGTRTSVQASFEVHGDEVRFNAPTPAEGRLVIDPCIHWTSYLGGATSDFGRDVAADADNNLIVTGYSSSKNFPVSPGSLQETPGGQIDVFIAKMAPDGRRFWCTYYGGSGSEEWPSVAINGSGEIAISGVTASPNFPVTGGAMQSAYAGNTDGFVLKLDGAGHREWATYLGGSYADEAADISFDERGAIIVTGTTYSTNFPVSSGAFQTSNAGDFDAFVFKLSASGQRMWGTYFGGWSMEYATGVATGAQGEIFITGYTEGENFPVTERGIQERYGGGAYDAFVAKFSTTGARQWCTYYGGSDEDKAARIVADREGGVYVCGTTKSKDLKVGSGAFQKEHAGVRDAFVLHMTAKGERLWDTYLGGNADDQAAAIAVDRGNVYVTGFTESPTFPVTSDAAQLTLAGAADAFIAVFDNTGMRIHGSFFGGRDSDLGYGLTVDKAGCVTMTGVTSSSDLPMTGQPAQRANAGIDDAFLIRMVFSVAIADAGDNAVICVGGSVRLGKESTGGFGKLTYRWTPALGLDDATSATPLASPAASTFYVLEVRDEAGCGGLDTVAVTVLPPITAEAGDDADVCPGGTAMIGRPQRAGELEYRYQWSPTEGLGSPDSSRTEARPRNTTLYRLTVSNKYKCTAVDSVLITVRDAPRVALGPDLLLCPGVPRQIGAEAEGGVPPYTYEWTPASGLTATTVAQPFANPAEATTYVVRITDAHGCQSSDSIHLAYHPRLIVDAGEEQMICFSQPVKLTGQVSGGKKPYTYHWSAVGGSSAASTMSVQVQPKSTTPYMFTVTDGNGCSASDTVLVRVLDRIDVSAGEDADICEGSSVVVGREARGGSAPYTYKWKPDIGISDATIATPEIRPTVTRTYVVHVTDAAGCTGSDTVTIVVRENPKVSAGKDQLICAGSSVGIGSDARGGTPPYTYSWSPAEGLHHPDAAQTEATPSTTTTYTLTVRDARGCTATSQVTITVEAPPLVSAGRDTSVCIGESVRLTATGAGGREPYRFEWSPAEGVSKVSSSSPEVSPQHRTTYVVRMTDARGCIAVDSIVVDVYSKPRGDAGRDTTICPGSPAHLLGSAIGGRPPYTFDWSPSEGLTDAHIPAPLALPAKTMTYSILVTDANGCTAEDQVKITVAPPLQVDAGPAPRVCTGALADLLAKAAGGIKPYVFTWTAGQRRERGPQPRFSFTATATMTAVVEVTDAAGCTATDSVLVPVPPPLTVAIPAVAPLCLDAATELTALVQGGTAPYMITWREMSERRAADRREHTGAALRVSPARTTEYQARVKDAMGCTAQTSVTVPVHPHRVPVIIARGERSFCDGDSVVLAASEGFTSYKWSDGSTQPVVTARASGTWTVAAIDPNGCETVSMPVEVKKKDRPRPVISVNGSAVIYRGSSVTLDAGGGYTSYRWSNGSGARRITVLKAGNYSVTVSSRSGCTASSPPVEVRVIEPPVRLTSKGDTIRSLPHRVRIRKSR